MPDMFSFGDFNNQEIANLIGSKDPLGLEYIHNKMNIYLYEY